MMQEAEEEALLSLYSAAIGLLVFIVACHRPPTSEAASTLLLRRRATPATGKRASRPAQRAVP